MTSYDGASEGIVISLDEDASSDTIRQSPVMTVRSDLISTKQLPGVKTHRSNMHSSAGSAHARELCSTEKLVDLVADNYLFAE